MFKKNLPWKVVYVFTIYIGLVKICAANKPCKILKEILQSLHTTFQTLKTLHTFSQANLMGDVNFAHINELSTTCSTTALKVWAVLHKAQCHVTMGSSTE